MREQLCLHRDDRARSGSTGSGGSPQGPSVPGLLDSGSHRLGQLAREARVFSPFSTPVSLQVCTAGPSFLKSGL